MTVQAPHWPRSQPFLVPVKSKRSRSRSSSVTRGSSSWIVLVTPFTVSVVARAMQCSAKAKSAKRRNVALVDTAARRKPSLSPDEDLGPPDTMGLGYVGITLTRILSISVTGMRYTEDASVLQEAKIGLSDEKAAAGRPKASHRRD